MTREEKQKAIDALKISAPVMAFTQEEFKDYILTLNKIMDWLEQQPRWIPVSERLPEKDKTVLLTICANSALYGFNENFVKVMCGSYSPCEDKRDWIVDEVRYYIDNVTAWMPLPESYKKEKED